MSLLRTLYYKFRLNRNLNKSRAEILKLREKKFRQLLSYTYQEVPFYRQLYQEAGINSGDLQHVEITDLPTINKEMVMDNLNQIIVPDITRQEIEEFLTTSEDPTEWFRGDYRVLHSSGSSGQIGYYLYNSRAWDFIKAIALRMFEHFGWERERYAFIGAADGHYAGISLFLSPVGQWVEWIYEDFLVLPISQPIEKHIPRLNEYQPSTLGGYPSGIKILAELQQVGEVDIAPKTIVCGGEPLNKEQKHYIQQTWGVEPVTNYSTSESLMMGVSRPEFEGLYIFDDANYIEIKENKILLTNLYNYTQPLIRYEIDDVLIPLTDGDDYWPFTQIQEIVGRQETALWLTGEDGSKKFIHPLVLVEFYVTGLKRFQIIKTGEESFVFKAVVETGYDTFRVKQRINQELQKLLAEKKLPNVNFKIKQTEELLPDPETGKYKLIKQSR